MYAMLATCPDLCYLVGYLSRFADNPSKEVWDAVIHTFRYIAGTLDYGLLYTPGTSSTLGFSAYLDLNRVSCVRWLHLHVQQGCHLVVLEAPDSLRQVLL